MVERDAGLPAASQAVRAEARTAPCGASASPKIPHGAPDGAGVLRRDAAAPERRDAAALLTSRSSTPFAERLART
jgi:hypothetical protein